MTTTAQRSSTTGLVTRGLQGAAAGVAGGLVFGMLMAMMGMLPMVAMLIGSESALVGFIVHLAISAGIGTLFGILAPTLNLGAMLALGAGYGVIWWFLGPLIIMPAWLGMPLFMFNGDTWLSLLGHVIFGVVTAAVLFGLRRRVVG